EFQSSVEVLANSQPIDADDYSVPSLADWNSDGRLDLLVGLKTSAGEGKVRVYLNAGTNEAPQYGTFSYAQQAGADLVVSGAGCMGMYPRLSDWDGDGRKDLVVGLASGGIQVFPNIGTAADPRFGAPGDVMVGEPGSKQPINVGARATPEIVDWNNDGRYDLVVGGLDGSVRVYINAAASGVADFRVETLVQAGGSPLVVPTGRASVAVVDLDGDSRKDLLLGNTEGQLLFYRNVGTDAAPLFDGWALVTAGGQVVDLPGTPRSRPFVGDVNADGMPDLLVGSQDGFIRRYAAAAWPVPLEGAGDHDLPGGMYRFTFDACVRAWTNPAIARDVDGDGTIARHDGQLVFDELNGRAYSNAAGQLGQVPRHGLALAHLDVNGDGYCHPLDALLVVHYLNTSGQGGEGEASERYAPIGAFIAMGGNLPASRVNELEDGIADVAATQSDRIPRHASPQVGILSAPRDDDAVSLMDHVAVRVLFGNDADIDSLLADLFGEQSTCSA
ncbi:MAG: VCBS repeat-containing protein, partial [Planctomycetes bacterium]|nr:VCBS repeat-containing protein [Planctomycetota bacterium]